MKTSIFYLILLLALLSAFTLSLGVGAMRIPLSDVVLILGNRLGVIDTDKVSIQYKTVIEIVRLPRVIMGITVGAALGISGAAVQGIFRNPLAEPGLIGISAGASLMAVGIIALEISMFSMLSNIAGYYLLVFGAFAGAVLAALLVYQLSKTEGRSNVATMLLAGIAVNALAGATTGLITYLANEQQLRNITFWMLGSLGGATWEILGALFPFVVVAIILLPRMGKALNAFALGEAQGDHLGLNISKVKRNVIVLSTMAVGASVAVSGIIGFVGLLVPHTVRLFIGVDHKHVLPGSALLGAFILTVADMVARTIIAPVELPIGVITALLGTPLFLYILIKDKKKILQ